MIINVKSLFSIIFISFSLLSQAQTKGDFAAIKQLCGCFSVTFNYAETFSNDTINKQYVQPMNKHAVIEYAFPIEESPTKIVIQHLLVIPDGKGTVIKHWREDWEYEQQERWIYTDSKTWEKVRYTADQVKGQWTQSVWEVTDSPRYAGSSQWVRTNNQLFWLNTTDAPLPRREYTKRRDYNIMERTNRIVVSYQGYVHEQDNKKIVRKSGLADSVLAEEKGFNHYVRLKDSDCAAVQQYWTSQQQDFWTDVRNVWSDIMNRSKRLKIEAVVEGKPLYVTMDELYQRQLSAGERKTEVQKLISRYTTIVE